MSRVNIYLNIKGNYVNVQYTFNEAYIYYILFISFNLLIINTQYVVNKVLIH